MCNHHRSHFVVCAYPPKPLSLAGDIDSAFDTATCTSIARQTSAASHILSVAVNMKSEASARWRWPLRADDWQSTPIAGCVTANHLLAGGATPPCQHLHAQFLQSFCEASPVREILASSPTTVGLEKISPSAGQNLSSPVDQHRRRVVPGEKLTYLSAAPRTSSTRDTLRRV